MNVTTQKSPQNPNVTMVMVDDDFSGIVTSTSKGRFEAWVGVERKRFLGAFGTREAAVEAVARAVS